MRLFSPWRYNIDHAARRLLDAAGWARPDPDMLPTGAELVEQYLQPLAKLPQSPRTCATTPAWSPSAGSASTGSRPPAGSTPRSCCAWPPAGHARPAVIDASGTWTTPNVLGANGLPAHGEPEPPP